LRARWASLTHQFEQWIQTIGVQNASHFNTGLCAVSVTAAGVSLAVLRHPDQHKLDLLVSFPLHQPDELASVLSDVVSDQGLKGMTTRWILAPDQYHLYLMDNLPVTADEFQSAIRWKLVELLPFPVEEAIIDSFQIPAQKTHDPHPMITVSVTRSDFLKTGAEAIAQSGLNLTSIGIQELSLRNIAALFEQDERSTALVYLEADRSEVLVTRESLLSLFAKRRHHWLRDFLCPTDSN